MIQWQHQEVSSQWRKNRKNGDSVRTYSWISKVSSSFNRHLRFTSKTLYFIFRFILISISSLSIFCYIHPLPACDDIPTRVGDMRKNSRFLLNLGSAFIDLMKSMIHLQTTPSMSLCKRGSNLSTMVSLVVQGGLCKKYHVISQKRRS